MIDLNPESISKKIFSMLTRDSQPPVLALEWRSEASSYLDTCKALFSEEHERRECLDSFQIMCEKIGQNIESHIVINFLTLFEREDEYIRKIREYLCNSLKNKFISPENVKLNGSGKSSIDEILDDFKNPIYFTSMEVKDVIEYVRRLSVNGREIINDLCQLAKLWTKSMPPTSNLMNVEGAIMSIESDIRSNEGLVRVLFDLLYTLDDSERCLDIFVTGITHVAVKDLLKTCSKGKNALFNTAKAYYSFLKKFMGENFLNSSEKFLLLFSKDVILRIYNDEFSWPIKSTINGKVLTEEVVTKEICMAYIGIALFDKNQEREPVIKSLAETLEQDIKEFSSEKWTRAFLDACISERPPDMIGRVYFFNLLYQTVISDNPRDKDIDFLSSKCQKYFLQGNMNGLVDEIFKWIISSDKKLDICLQKALSVSKVYGCEHPYRMLFDNFRKYKLFQEDNQERFIRITFKLLHGMTYIDPIERINCQKEIEELLLKDTVEFKVVSSDDARHNVDVIRDVLHKFQSVQYSKKVPNDIYIEVVTLLNRSLKTCSEYAAQQTDLAVLQKNALQEISSYGLKTKDGLFQTEVTEEHARSLYETGLIRTQVTVTDSNGVRLWHVSKNLIGTKITDDTLSDILKKDKGEFIRTVIQPWRDTFYQYCRFPEWNWYIFVEGHWYPHNASFFKDSEIKILKILRESPHRLSLKEIVKRSKYSANEVGSIIQSLLCSEYIVQDSRDTVGWNNNDATFFTNPQKREEIDSFVVTIPRLIYISRSSRREGNLTHFRIRIEAEYPGNEEAAWGGVTINVPSITSKDMHENTKIQAWSTGCDKGSPFWRLPGEKISGFRDDGSFGEIQTQCLFIESCVTSWKSHRRISLEAELTVPVHFTSLETHVRTWATWKKSDGTQRIKTVEPYESNGDPDWNDKKKVLDQQKIPAYSITIS